MTLDDMMDFVEVCSKSSNYKDEIVLVVPTIKLLSKEHLKLISLPRVYLVGADDTAEGYSKANTPDYCRMGAIEPNFILFHNVWPSHVAARYLQHRCRSREGHECSMHFYFGN